MRTNNCPNLDCLQPEELMAFWAHHQRGAAWQELFPEGGEGTRKATNDLANYASNKSAAMGCRLRGDIAQALMYEAICDRIYNELPDWARSW